MDNGKKTIDEIFTGNKFFYIPEYQRGYAWIEKQVCDFFEDFKMHYIDRNYYYGTVLLQEKSRLGNKESFEIVDGQQRITTLIIFVRCLINRLREINTDEYNADTLYSQFVNNKGYYILNLQQEDNDYFSTCILEDKSVLECKTPSQKKLLYARNKFVELLKNCDSQQIIDFVTKILCTNVLVYLVSNRSEATMIFETTNDRGKPLSNLEKTKSFLMYKASVAIEEPEQILEKIQTRFNEVYRDYAKIENSLIDENSILQYNFIAYEKWKNTKKQKAYQHYMESLKITADSFIKKNDVAGLLDYINTYTINVQQSYNAMSRMLQDNYIEFLDLKALGRIASFYPMLIKCYRADESSEKINYRKICRLCEILSFRVYVVLRYYSSKAQTTLYELAKDFDGNFDILTAKILSIIKSIGTNEKFVECLSDTDFYHIYSSSDKNYFFWKYENYLREKEQPIATPMSHEDLWNKNSKLRLTIEHIVAQRNSEEQSKIICNELNVVVGHATVFNKNYLNSIGNLTIDPQSANSSKGKSDVEVKNSKYFVKAPYKCQNELNAFMENEKWTINSINTRKAKLVDFAKKTWCDYSKYEKKGIKIDTVLIEDTESDEAEDNE